MVRYRRGARGAPLSGRPVGNRNVPGDECARPQSPLRWSSRYEEGMRIGSVGGAIADGGYARVLEQRLNVERAVVVDLGEACHSIRQPAFLSLKRSLHASFSDVWRRSLRRPDRHAAAEDGTRAARGRGGPPAPSTPSAAPARPRASNGSPRYTAQEVQRCRHGSMQS
jgi:hypothetical protein